MASGSLNCKPTSSFPLPFGLPGPGPTTRGTFPSDVGTGTFTRYLSTGIHAGRQSVAHCSETLQAVNNGPLEAAYPTSLLWELNRYNWVSYF